MNEALDANMQTQRERRIHCSTECLNLSTAISHPSNQSPANQNTMKRCNLCLAEKIEIIKADKNKSLNKQTELVSKCRDENASYLRKFRQDKPPLLVFTSSHLYWHPQYFQDFPGRLQALSGLLALFSTFLSGLLALFSTFLSGLLAH